MRHLLLFLLLSLSQIPAAAEEMSGVNLVLHGKYDEALVKLNQEIAEGRNVASAYSWRARCWRKADGTSDDDKAIADYTRSIELDPAQASAPYRNRGQCWARKGDYVRAVADFTKSLQLNPDMPFVGEYLATAHLQLKDYPAAIAVYNRLIPQATAKKDESWALPGYYYRRGYARAQTKDLNGAIADYTEAIKQPEAKSISMGGVSILDRAQYQRGRRRRRGSRASIHG